MKQILQNLSDGETLLVEVPAPSASRGGVLIETRSSLVSLGTEKMLMDFGKAGWIEKARKQPDKVKQVLGKIKTDGLSATMQAVKAKLDQPIPLGYSNAGVVLDPGDEASGLAVGERVVSNGHHAEIVKVPHKLSARIPDGVSFEEASFTVVGAIGLQGVRLLKPTLGETIAVTGLGLIGLLCVQMLRANGCRVLGIDFDSRKCELARQLGAETVDLSKGEDPVATGMKFTDGRGVDGVLITASTASNDPVHQGANMCRKRGRIVLVGVVGLQLSRADFYEKELSFQVSCSYGPGRYDPEYEDKGRDYPLGFVRWTEQRNFEAFLQMLEEGQLDVKPLISHRFDFEQALDGYGAMGAGNALGIVLNYSSGNSGSVAESELVRRVELNPAPTAGSTNAVVGLIGAGNFSGQVLLPALKATGARLKGIVSAGGVSGTHHGRKQGFEFSSTRVEDVMTDDEINLVLITTRHNSHAGLVKKALAAGKNVFVEKPLCLSEAELTDIEGAIAKDKPAGFVMVGFNRRFAPHVIKMKQLLASVAEPKSMVMTVNAGQLPADHWTQDPEVGGGRIIGEGCHFIDLIRFLVGAPISSVASTAMAPRAAGPHDTVSIQLGFEDGSLGTVHYFANGDKSYAKEKLEVFAAGKVLVMDNFRRLTGYGWKGFKKLNLWNQAKGHAEEMQAVVEAVKAGSTGPIPFPEIVEVTRASFAAKV